jgi:hypothetical protein
MTSARAARRPNQERRGKSDLARERAIRRRSLLYGIGITAAGTILALYALPLFIVIFGGMMPTLVVYFIDEQPGRYMFRTVGAMNLAGVIPFAESAYQLQSSTGLVGYPISDAQTWLTMYGSAFAGFMLAWVAPMVVGIVLDANHRSKLQRSDAERRNLVREWEIGKSEFKEPEKTPESN